jgi:glycosyltransferase involved in cell wall biosynthesis
MIVKNEKPIIEHCLNSVKNLIDYWVIVDTGSKDGTQAYIQKLLKDVPGELHERPWVDFGHNRTEALQLAQNKADYLLLLDADEEIQYSPNFILPALDKDYYFADFTEEDLNSSRVFLISSKRDWKYLGTMHEQLSSASAISHELMYVLVCKRKTALSARSQDPQKYDKDAQLLEEALQKDPKDSRNVFYLAQSYGNAGKLECALKNYQKRASMEGDEQEIFWSLFLIGALHEELKFPFETVLKSYQQAYEYRPNRAEPLVHLSNYLLQKKQNALAYCLAKLAFQIPYPGEELGGRIKTSVYTYEAHLTLCIAAIGVHKYQEALPILEQLKMQKNLPETVYQKIETCLLFCKKKQ